MRGDSKNSNKIDEEQLCMDCFVDFLKNQIGCREIQAKRESNDPPDFWLKVDGNKLAVEVTSLAKDAGYLPRCERLAKAIETEARENGWLCGKYILNILGKPEIPKMNSTAWREIVKIGLNYIHQTIDLSYAGEKILQRESKGVLKIEKIKKNGSTYIAVLGSDAKFEGSIQKELKEIIQEAISKKRDFLKGLIRVY